MLKMVTSTPVYFQNSPTYSQEIANLVKRITHGASPKVKPVKEVLPVLPVLVMGKMVAYHQLVKG